MKQIAIAAAALLAFGSSTAGATGINLSWSDCGAAGAASQTFDCTTNTGAPFSLIASFIPPAGVDEFLGMSAQIDVTTPTATLPDWWKHGTIECRSTNGMSTNFDFQSLPVSCTDFYQGQAVGGSLYTVGYGAPNRGRLQVQAAVPFDNRGPVDAGTEYAAVRVNIQRTRSSGAGSCSGCTVPACIVLNSIQLFQPPDRLNDPEISNPANSNFVTWQASTVANCPQSTAAPGKTWGQVKSLYR